MEDGELILRVLHEQDLGYTFVGNRSVTISTIEEAIRAIAHAPLGQAEIDSMLSAEGVSRQETASPSYRKYVLEAYLDGSIVDKITFVCRYN